MWLDAIARVAEHENENGTSSPTFGAVASLAVPRRIADRHAIAIAGRRAQTLDARPDHVRRRHVLRVLAIGSGEHEACRDIRVELPHHG